MRRFLLLILMMYVVPSVSFAAPIHDAAKAGDVAAITAALDAGADINAKTGKGKTPLMNAASRGHVEIVRVLLKEGALREAKDLEGFTALQLAERYGRQDVVQFLKQ